MFTLKKNYCVLSISRIIFLYPLSPYSYVIFIRLLIFVASLISIISFLTYRVTLSFTITFLITLFFSRNL